MMKRNAQFAQEFLGLTPQAAAKKVKTPVNLTLGLQSENPDAYQITIDKKGITIQGASESGVFYGIQTLRKSVALEEGDTMLTLKLISPTRLVKNALYSRILEAEKEGAAVEDLRQILGKAATKRGIFEGDVENGELEIGQIASAVKEIKSVADIMATLEKEFDAAQARVAQL